MSSFSFSLPFSFSLLFSLFFSLFFSFLFSLFFFSFFFSLSFFPSPLSSLPLAEYPLWLNLDFYPLFYSWKHSINRARFVNNESKQTGSFQGVYINEIIVRFKMEERTRSGSHEPGGSSLLGMIWICLARCEGRSLVQQRGVCRQLRDWWTWCSSRR